MLPKIQAQNYSLDNQLDLVFQALADRTRRAILSQLSKGPATITELAKPFKMSLPGVSKHLRVLERAHLVTRTVDGRIHRCSLKAHPMKEAEHWLSDYRVFWENNLDALARYIETEENEN